MTTVIRAPLAILDADEQPIRDAAVVVDGTTITAAGPANEVRIPEGATEVDARGLTMLPGFVDTHLHMTTVGAGKLHEEADRTPEQGLVQGRENAWLAVSTGVTTVRDIGSWNDAVFPLRKEIESGERVGPRIAAAGAPMTAPKGHCYFFGGEVRGVEGVREGVRRQKAAGADHIKIMVTGGWATPGTNPRAPQFSDEELQAMVDEAHRLDILAVAHVTATDGVRQAIRAGVDTLEHCMFQTLDGTWEYPSDVVDEIIKKNFWVNFTNAWHYRTVQNPPPDLPAKQLEVLKETREARNDAYRRMLAQGVKRYMVGTDGGGTNPYGDFALVCELMVRDLGMSERDTLRAATKMGAESLRLSDRIGRLKPGMDADIALVEGNPLEDITALARVRKVVLRGRVVEDLEASAPPVSRGGGPTAYGLVEAG